MSDAHLKKYLKNAQRKGRFNVFIAIINVMRRGNKSPAQARQFVADWLDENKSKKR